jgi:hypothetical protein
LLAVFVGTSSMLPPLAAASLTPIFLFLLYIYIILCCVSIIQSPLYCHLLLLR